MDFGITIAPHIERWGQIQLAEHLDYDRAWVPDSQMIWSDYYAILAIAAVNTQKIHLGTGVSIAGTRIAPVTAHSIATINQLAPGRTFLGLGTGHTAMRVMGQDPMPVRQFREYLRVVRALLDGQAVDYTYGGNTREIEFLHKDRQYVNVNDRVPIYVAGNGPKACQAPGAYGDGWTTIGRDTAQLAAALNHIGEGAENVGRLITPDFHTTLFTCISVLKLGENLTSERIINEVGSWATPELHFFYEIWNKSGRKDEMSPPHFINMWDEYLTRIDGFSLPENARFRQIHDGHAIYLVPEERRFVTPGAIRAICMVGSAEDIIDQVRTVESAGIKEINIMPAMDHAEAAIRDFADFVMPAFR